MTASPLSQHVAKHLRDKITPGMEAQAEGSDMHRTTLDAVLSAVENVTPISLDELGQAVPYGKWAAANVLVDLEHWGLWESVDSLAPKQGALVDEAIEYLQAHHEEMLRKLAAEDRPTS